MQFIDVKMYRQQQETMLRILELFTAFTMNFTMQRLCQHDTIACLYSSFKTEDKVAIKVLSKKTSLCYAFHERIKATDPIETLCYLRVFCVMACNKIYFSEIAANS